MEKLQGMDLMKRRLPFITKWYNLLILYIFHFALLIGALMFLYWLSNIDWYYALMGQTVMSFFAVFPFIYITINSEKIRKKYLKNYKNMAYQHFWFRFGSYNEPICTVALLFPLLLKSDYMLPTIIDFKENFITTSFLPIYIAIPLGLILIIFGLLIRKPSGGYDIDISSYISVIFPEDSRRLQGGLYKYIRHPQYSGRGILAIGFGIISNSLLAISASIIYFLFYYILTVVEDHELIKRFGDDFKKYCKEKPAIFPKLCNFKDFTKELFQFKN